MKFVLSDTLTIDTDDERVQKEGLRIGTIAMSGAGKSTLIAKIKEQAKQQGAQIVIIDVHGEYFTFAEVFQDMVIIGGENADLPLSADFADVYAEAYRMGKSLDFNFREVFIETSKFAFMVEKILRALWRVQVNFPRPALWTIEEAHLVVPQDKSPDTQRRVDLVNGIATGGRKFGVSLIVATQRAALLNKTTLSQCWIRFFGKIVEDIDKKALKGYLTKLKVKKPRKGEKAQKPEDKLMELKTGEFYVFGWFKEPRLVKIDPTRITRDGAKTILVKPIERATTESTSIAELKKMIEERMKKQEEETTAFGEAKKRILTLENELTTEKKERERAETALKVASSIKLDINSKGVDPQELIAAKTEAELAKKGRQDAENKLKTIVGGIHAKIEGIFEEFIIETTPVATEQLPVVSNPEAPQITQSTLSVSDKVIAAWKNKIPNLEARKIFNFLTDNKGSKFLMSEVATQTGYSATSGSFGSAIRWLRRNGLLKKSGKEVWFE